MSDNCVCGQPQIPNTVHRLSGPCYVDEKYLMDSNLRWEVQIPWWKRLYLRVFRRYTG